MLNSFDARSVESRDEWIMKIKLGMAQLMRGLDDSVIRGLRTSLGSIVHLSTARMFLEHVFDSRYCLEQVSCGSV